MRTRLAWVAAAMVASALAPASAHAQAPAPAPAPAPQGPAPSATDTRALAEMLFFTARGLMEAGRYAEACGKLNESYRLDAAAGTLLNLAVCNEKIGKTASAWGEFRDALAEARRMNRPDREKLATEHIAALEPELSYLTLTVPPAVRAVRGLEITRNGIPLTSAAWDTDLPVDPGDVEVVEHAPLYKPRTLHVNVAPKQHAALVAVPLELAPIERPPQAFWTGKRTAGAVLAIAGVGFAAAATVFGLGAINDKKTSDNNCPTTAFGTQCNQQGVDSMNKANSEAWVSNAGFVLAAAGVGIGAYLFFSGAPAEEKPAAPTIGSTGWTWAVGASPGGAMGAVSRSF